MLSVTLRTVAGFVSSAGRFRPSLPLPIGESWSLSESCRMFTPSCLRASHGSLLDRRSSGSPDGAPVIIGFCVDLYKENSVKVPKAGEFHANTLGLPERPVADDADLLEAVQNGVDRHTQQHLCFAPSHRGGGLQILSLSNVVVRVAPIVESWQLQC